jgi:hypothetical protein
MLTNFGNGTLADDRRENTFAGAAPGCAIGHHEAKQNEKNDPNDPQ